MAERYIKPVSDILVLKGYRYYVTTRQSPTPGVWYYDVDLSGVNIALGHAPTGGEAFAEGVAKAKAHVELLAQH